MNDEERIPYLRVPRNFFDEGWLRKKCFDEKDAELDMAYMARYKPHVQIVRGKAIELKENEFVASLSFLEKRWNWSRNRLLNFLRNRERNGALNRRQNQGEGIISYDIFATYGNENFEAEPLAEPLTQPPSRETEPLSEPPSEPLSELESQPLAQPPAQLGMNNSTCTKTESCESSKFRAQPPAQPLAQPQPQPQSEPQSEPETEPKYKTERRKDGKTESIYVARLLFRVAKIIKPNISETEPRPKKERDAWKRLSPKPTLEEIELMEWFYRLPKSDRADETWRRKMDVPAMINNWQDQREVAEQLRSRFVMENGLGNGNVQKKESPPYSEDSNDPFAWVVRRPPAAKKEYPLKEIFYP